MHRLRLTPLCLFVSIACAGTALSVAACDDGRAGSGDHAISLTGCKVAGGRPPTAPNGYYVNGNTICTQSGQPHILHGVDRPSLEWAAAGEHLSAADFKGMAAWHANVVRVALNQDFWLSDSPVFVPTYAGLVDQVVQWAHAADLDVILDLHWSDMGDYSVKPGQQLMADEHSLQFWKEVATRYKGDGRVFFELYNEPHDVAPNVWLSGGSATGFTAVGMQELHDAVRGVGANNLVIVGGLNWAFDLSVVGNGAVAGYNIAYATHPYNQGGRSPEAWYGAFGFLAATSPIVVTEFGDNACATDYDTQLIEYADSHSMSWTAWAWYPGGCSFPALITNWSYGTSTAGSVVKTALLGYHDPWPPLPAGAGSDAGDDAATPPRNIIDGRSDGGIYESEGADAGEDAPPSDADSAG